MLTLRGYLVSVGMILLSMAISSSNQFSKEAKIRFGICFVAIVVLVLLFRPDVVFDTERTFLFSSNFPIIKNTHTKCSASIPLEPVHDPDMPTLVRSFKFALHIHINPHRTVRRSPPRRRNVLPRERNLPVIIMIIVVATRQTKATSSIRSLVLYRRKWH